MNSKISFISLIFCVFVLLVTHYGYYPKWKMEKTEATLSWDVSGYYMYLPAAFIYHDLKQCKFKDEIIEKYHPAPGFQQAFVHEPSGNYVMKYSLGQALVFSPFFFMGHLWALNDVNYSADGFSLPYQFMISLGTLLIAVFGLYFLRKVLLEYFKDTSVALSLIGIVIGTNYLNYSAIDGAMTHNTLFSLYALLIWLSIKFYKKPTLALSISIGLCVGLAALIRPSELLSALIPLFWGIKSIGLDGLKARYHLLRSQHKLLLISVLAALFVGSLQLIYWKYASGEWIVYSYQDQGFSWLSPHIWSGLMSYKSGWLIYSPLMIFAVLGFLSLYLTKKDLFYTSFLFSGLFIYIAFAWDIWWYGGSLGQRTMVQAYPILAFPFTSMIQSLSRGPWYVKAFASGVGIVFISASLWFTHQAHKGGLLHVSQMTGPYYWKTIFTFDHHQENLKLLDDIDDIYEGQRINLQTIHLDTSFVFTLSQEHQHSDTLVVSMDPLVQDFDRIRVFIEASIQYKEWNPFAMTHFIVVFKNKEWEIDSKMIKLQRHLVDNETKSIYLDTKLPKAAFDNIEVRFWNSNGDKPISLSDLRMEVYNVE